jgi:gliding motility-associated-like protein
LACNYNATVTTDNGGCLYPEEGEPCSCEVTAAVSDTILLPDLNTLSMDVLIDLFDEGAIVEGCDDLQSITINMEHSFIGDLTIVMECPNGQSMLLLENGPNGAEDPTGCMWPDLGGTNLGFPGEEGWDYTWSDDANYIIDDPNNPDVIGVSAVPEGEYLPCGSFCDLIGCPLNGIWTLVISDNWGGDSGTLFEWGLNFGACDGPSACHLIDLANPGSGCISVCANGNTTVTAPFDPGVSYNWTIDGGAVVDTLTNPANVEIAWESSGVGGITLQMTSPAGTTVLQQCIDIGESPVASFLAPEIACLGGAIPFASTATAGTAHFWDFGDGVTSDEVNPTHHYDSPGIYSVSLSVFSPLYDESGNEVCNCSGSFVQEIEVFEETGPSIECHSTLCEGDSSCYWTTDGCAGAEYMWTVSDFEGNPVAFEGQGTPEICLQWNSGPTGTVALQISGCGTACPAPTVLQVPIVPSTASVTGPDMVCAGSPAVYSVPQWMDVVYAWYVEGASSYEADGNTVTVIWGPAGPGTVSASYYSPFLGTLTGHFFPDCSGEAALTVDIRPALTFTESPSSACAQTTAIFMASSDAVNWTVNPNQTGTIDGAEFAIDFEDVGYYVVTATASDPAAFCNSDVSSTTVVQEVPDVTVAGPIEGCTGVDLPYAVESMPPGYSHLWTATGATPAESSGSITLLNWNASDTAHSVVVTTSMNAAPFCTASDTLHFSPLVPSIPIGLDHDEACANVTDTFVVQMSAPLNGEELLWTIDPPASGSVLQGQGLDTLIVQWNNPSDSVMVTVTSILCNDSTSLEMEVAIHPTPHFEIVQTGDVCPGAFEAATLSTDSTFETYFWTLPNDSNSTAATMTDLTPFDYSVTVSNVFGCVGTSSLEVEASPVPASDVHSTTNIPLCPGVVPEILLLAPVNANWIHTWSDGTIANNLTFPLTGAASSVSVTTSDATSGCEASSSEVIETTCGPGGGGGGGEICTYTTGLLANVSQDCNTVSFGTDCTNCTDISWSIGGGSATGDSTYTFSEAGCFDIVVFGNVPSTTEGDTCYVDEEFYVCIPIASNFRMEQQGCTEVAFTELTTYLDIPGENNEITEWAWDFGDGTTSSEPNPVHTYADTGQYTVTLAATAANGCQATFSNPLPLSSFSTFEPQIEWPICAGSPSYFSVVAPGATEYSWEFPDGTENEGNPVYHTFDTIPADNVVHLTMLSAFGCELTSDIVIDIFPAPLDPLAGLADVAICPSVGEVLISSNPGFFDHQWFDAFGPITGATDPELLAGDGIFHVNANDANGCSVQSSEVEVQILPDPLPSIVGPGLVCNEGTVEYEVSGNYVGYEWYVDGITTGTEATLSLPGTPGDLHEIQVIVTGGNGCVHSSNVHTTEWVAGPDFTLVGSSTPQCANPGATISIDPIEPDVSYFWNTGSTEPSISGAQAGVYTATGIDQHGCVHSISTEVYPLPDLSRVPSGCYETCAPELLCGPADIYTYEWYLNDAPISFSNQPCLEVEQSGTYHLVGGNQFGCTSQSDPLELTLDSCICDITASMVPDSTCCAAIDFTNGSSVEFNTAVIRVGESTATFDVAEGFSILAMGSDSIQIQYQGGTSLPQGDLGNVVQICFDEPGTHTVDWSWSGIGPVVCDGQAEWVQPSVTHVVDDEICPDACDGAIISTIEGGVIWTSQLTDADGNEANASNLCPGIYAYSATEINGCSLTDTFEITGPDDFEFDITINEPLCHNGMGTVCIENPSGASGELTFTVMPTTVEVGANCYEIDAGFHQILVEDTLGCTANPYNFTVAQPDALQTLLDITPVSCFGGADGAIAIQVAGGTEPIALASPFAIPMLPDTLFNLVSDSLELIVTDANGCLDTSLAIVTEPELPITLTLLDVTGIDCNGECTGVAEVEANGGTGPLSFFIGSVTSSNAINPEGLSALCAGEQILFVSDMNGCSDSVALNIPTSAPLEFYINAEDVTCTGMTDGSYQIGLFGGSGNVGWVILGEAVVQDALAEGVYELYGFDDLGCEVDSSFVIGAETVSDMMLDMFSTPVSCWETSDGTATVAVTGGIAPITYAWNDSNGQSTSTAVGLEADTYVVVVTDDIGCTYSESVEVESNEDCLFIADGITPNGDGINDTWVVGGLEFFPSSSVTVHNRWGQVMFESAPGTTPWDGTFNGQFVPASDYYFVIRTEPGKKPITGTVTVKY